MDWQQEVTMTREQLQAERDAWYANGLANGALRRMRQGGDGKLGSTAGYAVTSTTFLRHAP